MKSGSTSMRSQIFGEAHAACTEGGGHQGMGQNKRHYRPERRGGASRRELSKITVCPRLLFFCQKALQKSLPYDKISTVAMTKK